MKKRFLFLILLSASTSLMAQQALNPAIEKNVDDLLKQMTLEEKVGQMAQVSIESLGSTRGENFSFGDKMPEAVSKYLVGSVLNTHGFAFTGFQAHLFKTTQSFHIGRKRCNEIRNI